MTQKRFRVLVLADAGSFHTERYISALRKQSCHPLLLSLEPGPVRHLSLKSRGPIRTLHYVLAVPQIRKILKRFRPDVINPHFASGYGFIAALASRGRHSPLVCHVWGSDILIVPH
ncbi:MAG TPA: glycosyltransferase, partial [candidate division Zixibacteria bacterium]|nr:glycosyltransferase [candidate division Zixibacteria bacterium]